MQQAGMLYQVLEQSYTFNYVYTYEGVHVEVWICLCVHKYLLVDTYVYLRDVDVGV